MRKTSALLLLPMAALMALSSAVLAQNYPAKTVRVIVPWPPGGSNDIVARLVAQKLTENAGQQFIIDNRGGASGIVGSDLVAKSPADGYTFMIHSTTHVSNPHLYSKIPYDTMKDLSALRRWRARSASLLSIRRCRRQTSGNSLISAASVPARSLILLPATAVLSIWAWRCWPR